MPTDREEKSMAAGLKKYLENFTTVLLFVYQVHNIISTVSQKESIRNAQADKIKTLRNSFEEVKEDAVNIAQACGVNEEFQHKRVGKVNFSTI